MIKKIFTIIVTLIFILFTAFILLNKNFANQIVISAEDVYDKVTGDYEIPEDVSEIKINELQPENSTFYYNLLNENQKEVMIKVDSVTQITEEQSAHIEEINATIQTQTESIEEVTKVVYEINEISKRIDEKVAKYKIREEIVSINTEEE